MERLYRINEVCQITARSESVIYADIRRKLFPAPCRLGTGNAARWRESDLMAWMAGLPQGVRSERTEHAVKAKKATRQRQTGPPPGNGEARMVAGKVATARAKQVGITDAAQPITVTALSIAASVPSLAAGTGTTDTPAVVQVVTAPEQAGGRVASLLRELGSSDRAHLADVLMQIISACESES